MNLFRGRFYHDRHRLLWAPPLRSKLTGHRLWPRRCWGALAEADKPCSKAWQFCWDSKTVAKRYLTTSSNCLWKFFILGLIHVLNTYISIILFFPMVITCPFLQGTELIFRHQKCLLHILNVEGKLIYLYGILNIYSSWLKLSFI